VAATAVPTKGSASEGRKRHHHSTLAAATSHKIKVICLARMAEKPTSPAEIGRELGKPASHVSYHVKVLGQHNLVEQVDERPVRGAVEHFFRTVELVHISQEEYEGLPLELRKVWVETVFALFGADATYSIETETMLKQVDCEILRTAMKVDAQGWEDMRRAYIDLQERVMEIKAESEIRLATDEKLTPRPILSFLSLFDMPPARP